MNLVDLMCEFVEAMNPGLQLSRYDFVKLITINVESLYKC